MLINLLKIGETLFFKIYSFPSIFFIYILKKLLLLKLEKMNPANQNLQNNYATNRLISSMKCVLQIFNQLDVINLITEQFKFFLSQSHINGNELFINSFNEILNISKQFSTNILSKDIYEQKIVDFINEVFNRNNSGISGTRPIILFFMISKIIEDDINQYFNDITKNKILDDIILKNDFSVFNNIIPMDNQNIKTAIIQLISEFKNKYKGPLVDNFYFLILSTSRCPNCNNLFGIRILVTQFLQLDVNNPQNNISDLINNHFSGKLGLGNYICQNCGLQGQKYKKLYCLNLPNYLILEFEDRNNVIFTDNITLQLYNGEIVHYQYFANVYKYIENEERSFRAVIKIGNDLVLYKDDNIEPYSQNNIDIHLPSMAIYKKI